MKRRKTTINDTTRTAALAILRTGEATPAEIADLAGMSRQIVRYWAEAAALDWQAARTARLRRLWARHASPEA